MTKWEGEWENLNRLEEQKALELNFNWYVVVSLTEDWKNILKKYFLDALKDYDFYKNYGYSSMEEYVEKEQLPNYYKDGYCKIQLRELMHIFWRYLFNGTLKRPFEGNKIYFLESNNEEAIDWAKKVSGKMNKRLLDVLS